MCRRRSGNKLSDINLAYSVAEANKVEQSTCSLSPITSRTAQAAPCHRHRCSTTSAPPRRPTQPRTPPLSSDATLCWHSPPSPCSEHFDRIAWGFVAESRTSPIDWFVDTSFHASPSRLTSLHTGISKFLGQNYHPWRWISINLAMRKIQYLCIFNVRSQLNLLTINSQSNQVSTIKVT